MRLTAKQFEVAWRALVKVHDRAIRRRRDIPDQDADDLRQELAVKLLTVGDPAQATVERQWLAFFWPAARFLRLNYFRARTTALARFVNVEDVDQKGADDELTKGVALGELRDATRSKVLREYLDTAIEPGKRPLTDAERQRRSRAKKSLRKTLSHFGYDTDLPD